MSSPYTPGPQPQPVVHLASPSTPVTLFGVLPKWPALFATLGLALLLAATEATFLWTFRRGLNLGTWSVLPFLLGLAALRLPLQWGLARLEALRFERLMLAGRRRILRALRSHRVSYVGRDLKVTLHVALGQRLPRAVEGRQAERAALGAALQLAVLLPVALFSAPKAAWLFLPLALPAYALVRAKSRALRHEAVKVQQETVLAERELDTWLDGLESLGANGALRQTLAGDLRQTRTHAEAQGRWQSVLAVFPAWMELFFFAGLASVAAFSATLSTGSGAAGLRDWVLLAGALMLAYRPVREWAKAWPHVAAGQAAATELEALIASWKRIPRRVRPSASQTEALEVADIAFAYAGGKTVFSHYTAAFPLEAITGLEGPNGAGKTTLLRLLAGLENPMSGEVRWPEPLRQVGHVAYLPQRLWLPHDLPKRWERWAKSGLQRFEHLEHLLGTAPLRHRTRFDVRELSGGERQRLALFMTLMSDAPFLLLDEPTSFLPGAEREALLSSLLACWRAADGPSARPRGALVVAHEPFLASLCDRHMVLQPRARAGVAVA